MTESEILGASQTRLIAWADFLCLRPVGKKGTYWIRKQARHPITKRDFTLKQSMRTSDLRTAILRAHPVVQKFLSAVQTHLAPMISSLPSTYSSVGSVLKVYLEWEHGQKMTRTRNAAALRRIIREAHSSEPDAMCVEIADARLARVWLHQQQQIAAKEFLPHDRDGFERRKRSRNQCLANAQSIFSRRALQHYRDMSLAVPDCVRAFAGELGLEARPAPPPEEFTQQEIATIRAKMPALRDEDPIAYAALMLMLHAGLRTGEAIAARWGWISNIGEHMCIDVSTCGAFEPKGRDGWVGIDPALLAALPCLNYPPAPGDPLLPGKTEYERREGAHRHLNQHLAKWGIKRVNGKLGYRARGHAITQVYLADGPRAAKEFGRHTVQATTDRYYMGAKVPYAPLKLVAS